MFWWKYFVRIYWGARYETVDQCAEKLAQCLSGLRTGDSGLAGWSMDLAGAPLSLEHTQIVEALLKGCNRDDAGRIIDELGYSLSLHCGSSREDWIMLRTNCGTCSSSPTVGNDCILFLPELSGVRRELLGADQLAQVLSEMARSWDADWGMVSTIALDTARSFMDPRMPHGGWIVYLNRRLFPPGNMPWPWRESAVGQVGSIFFVINDMLDVGCMDHLASIDLFTQWVQGVLVPRFSFAATGGQSDR